MRRVVITGMGALTPIGNTVEETWKSIKEGKSGIAPFTHFSPENNKVKYGAEIKNFQPELYMDTKEARKMARFTQYAVAASKMALDDANLTDNKEVLEDAGCVLGVGIGGFEVTESSCISYYKSNMSRTAPLTIPQLIPNEAAGNVCIQFGIHGLAHTVATACASGTDALGDAFDMVRSGRLDVCLAGGAESTINGFAVVSFEVLHALSTSYADDPTKACRPFDKKREGFIMGEGSAILVLEEYEHAKARGAKIYAEIAGYGSSCDGYHLTSPNPDGVVGSKCMSIALKDAGMKPEDIDYINTHGTSTPAGDTSEAMAISSLFGDHVANMPINSIKSMTGHLLGGSSAIEAIATVLTLRDGIIPPTINHFNDDPSIDPKLDIVYWEARKKDMTYALSNAFGFGGHNGALVFKKA